MKFAKMLARVVKLSAAFCRESFWLDYKALKKLLHGCEKNGAPLLSSLENNPAEVNFFAQLSVELAKVAEFYVGGWVEPVPSSARHPPLSALQAETEEAFSTRYLEVTSSCRAMLASGLAGDAATRGGSGSSHAEELVELLSRVTRLYMALLQLENFAVLNYCGFGKILKKHDKVSGFVTKSRFMQRLVHPQAFTHTRRLQRMLRGSENCYSMLVAALSASGLRHEGLSGQDAAALADLRATNEAVARQRSLEDDPESASDAAEEPADGAGLGRGGAAAVPTREAGSVASSASAAAPAAASPSEASPTAPATRKRRRNEAQTGVA